MSNSFHKTLTEIELHRILCLSCRAFESIENHHIALMLEKGVFLENADTNPFLNEIREASRLAKLDFIINAVFDADEDVKTVVGHVTGNVIGTDGGIYMTH